MAAAPAAAVSVMTEGAQVWRDDPLLTQNINMFRPLITPPILPSSHTTVHTTRITGALSAVANTAPRIAGPTHHNALCLFCCRQLCVAPEGHNLHPEGTCQPGTCLADVPITYYTKSFAPQLLNVVGVPVVRCLGCQQPGEVLGKPAAAGQRVPGCSAAAGAGGNRVDVRLTCHK